MARGMTTGLSTLELFLMAVVKQGVDNFYKLQHRAGVNPGAVHKAVRGLEKKGLLERGIKGARGRQTLMLTDDGLYALRAHWLRALDEPFDGPDALARAVWLTYEQGCLHPDKIMSWLTERARKLQDQAEELKDMLPPPFDSDGYFADSLEAYQWTKRKAHFHHFQGMAAALKEFAVVAGQFHIDD
jgi:DNA-binding MarR family transcriptional regulator